MSRKDYLKAVKIIRTVCPMNNATRKHMVTAFSTFFQDDLPRFDVKRFVDACEKGTR
jgi:hypothetical protein